MQHKTQHTIKTGKQRLDITTITDDETGIKTTKVVSGYRKWRATAVFESNRATGKLLAEPDRLGDDRNQQRHDPMMEVLFASIERLVDEAAAQREAR